MQSSPLFCWNGLRAISASWAEEGGGAELRERKGADGRLTGTRTRDYYAVNRPGLFFRPT